MGRVRSGRSPRISALYPPLTPPLQGEERGLNQQARPRLGRLSFRLPSFEASEARKLPVRHRGHPVIAMDERTCGRAATLDLGPILDDAAHLPGGMIDIRIGPDLAVMKRIGSGLHWDEPVIDRPAGLRRH